MVERGAHTLAKAEVVEETEAAAEAYEGAGAGVVEECSFLHSQQCQAGRHPAAHLQHPAG